MIASDRLQDEHRWGMPEEDRMHIAGHSQRIALCLALYRGAVDGLSSVRPALPPTGRPQQ